jgi:hypothetical protein
MELALTIEQAQELASLLSSSLGEMSSEIADTDNPEFRARLHARRRLLAEVSEALGRLLGSPEEPDEPLDRQPEALVREMARPGD